MPYTLLAICCISGKDIFTVFDSKQVDNQSLLSTDEALHRLQDIRISLPG